MGVKGRRERRDERELEVERLVARRLSRPASARLDLSCSLARTASSATHSSHVQSPLAPNAGSPAHPPLSPNFLPARRGRVVRERACAPCGCSLNPFCSLPCCFQLALITAALHYDRPRPQGSDPRLVRRVSTAPHEVLEAASSAQSRLTRRTADVRGMRKEGCA